MKTTLATRLRQTWAAVIRFHRDERGDTLEYAAVLAAFAIPMMGLLALLRNILSDYYSMIAFYVGWPFL
jgi:Flp pilus assembly pilin Flp